MFSKNTLLQNDDVREKREHQGCGSTVWSLTRAKQESRLDMWIARGEVERCPVLDTQIILANTFATLYQIRLGSVIVFGSWNLQECIGN
jgi:hypothetical protein